MVDIAGLRSDVDHLRRDLRILAVLGLGVSGLIWYNVYLPMQSLSTDSAVQASVMDNLKADVGDINAEQKRQSAGIAELLRRQDNYELKGNNRAR